MLRAHAASVQPGEEVDPEITKAIEENETVMYAALLERATTRFHLHSFFRCSGSQSERISMLKMALLDKGIVAGSHYDLAPPVVAAPAAASPTEDGGVDL